MDRELDFELGFPTNILMLGRVVCEQGWQVSYLDMPLEEKEGYDSFAELDYCLKDSAIKSVGISNHTVRTSVTTRTVAEYIKLQRPDVRVVVGGVNATFMWRELMEPCSAIDYVLRGYAQQGLIALCKTLQTGQGIPVPGLVSRSEEGFDVEQMAPVGATDFAMPELAGIDVDRYLAWTRTYPLMTHSGCGFSCNFCTSVMPGPYQDKEVYRPVEEVIAEMLQATDRGFERFFMSANIFTSRRDYCLALCDAMWRAGIPGRAAWACMTRLEFVDEELLDAMKKAGCDNVAFGVESASKEQWRTLRKGRFLKDSVVNAFRICKQAGLSTTAYLMIGAPSQTREEIEATIDLIRLINPDYRVISFFQPFPGTPYWDDPERFGLSEIAPLEEWNFHEAPICRTSNLDKKYMIDAAQRLYLDRGINPGFQPSVDSLYLTIPRDQLAQDMPLPAQDAFSMLKSTLPIEAVLERVNTLHGERGRLIAMHWLSAGLRDGFLQASRENV